MKGIDEGKEFIDVSAKELYKQLSRSVPTVPTCCCAMNTLMLQGDEYIANPKTTCGYSTKMVIRYYLNDLDRRECLHPAKKRGRKKLYDKEYLERFLSDRSFQYEKKGQYYYVDTKGSNWVICVPRTNEKNIYLCVGELIHRMDNKTHKISLFCTMSHLLVSKWGSIQNSVKEKLNISLLILSDTGEIEETL